jgi:hypothetical protein
MLQGWLGLQWRWTMVVPLMPWLFFVVVEWVDNNENVRRRSAGQFDADEAYYPLLVKMDVITARKMDVITARYRVTMRRAVVGPFSEKHFHTSIRAIMRLERKGLMTCDYFIVNR